MSRLGTLMSRLGKTVVCLFLTHEIIFVTILLYLVLSTFLHLYLGTNYGGFFHWTSQLRICWFFSIGMTRLAFSFFSNIYLYIFSLRQWFFELLAGFFPYRKCYHSIGYLIYIYICIYIYIYIYRRIHIHTHIYIYRQENIYKYMIKILC